MIYTKIAEIGRKVKALPKTRKNQQQNFMFRGIDDVMNVLHEAFAEAGVFILPETVSSEVTDSLTKNGTIQYRTRSKFIYHFVAEDGSQVSSTVIGEAADTGDKGQNKAMSIALKYALLQMFLIPTEEKKDPDYDTPEDTTTKRLLLESAIKAVSSVKSRKELEETWNLYPSLKEDPEFLDALKKAGERFPKNNSTTNQNNK